MLVAFHIEENLMTTSSPHAGRMEIGMNAELFTNKVTALFTDNRDLILYNQHDSIYHELGPCADVFCLGWTKYVIINIHVATFENNCLLFWEGSCDQYQCTR
jgi:hypothetical protein